MMRKGGVLRENRTGRERAGEEGKERGRGGKRREAERQTYTAMTSTCL